MSEITCISSCFDNNLKPSAKCFHQMVNRFVTDYFFLNKCKEIIVHTVSSGHACGSEETLKKCK